MRRWVGAATVAILLLGTGAASAHAAVYEGELTGQPDSTISLTTGKQGGKRFLTGYHVGFTVPCDGGEQSPGLTAEGQKWRIRDGHFKHVEGSPDTTDFFRLVGDLKRNGKAVGKFRWRNFGFYGTQCDTGTLDWVAFKQPSP